MKANEPPMKKNARKPPQDQINALAELYHQMKFSEVLEKGVQVAAQHPNDITILNILGAANAALKQWDHAADCYRKAVKIAPDDDGYYNLGVILYNLGERSEAMESFLHALKINPAHPEANSNLGLILCDLGRNDEAIKRFRQAIQVNPNYAEAHSNLGLAHAANGKYDKAIACYNAALKFNSDLASTRAEQIYLKNCICDWQTTKKEIETIPKLGIVSEPVQPFVMLALEDAPERHRLRSEIYAQTNFPQSPLPLSPKPIQKPDRLHIGYFSADFYNHAVMNLMGKVFETHDRKQFCVHAFSIGPQKFDETRKQLTGKFDKFHDVFDENDRTIAELARMESVDIAVDLNGYTKNHRTGIFAYRAAPIQINYLGYPGTMGADFMEYIIADSNLIPTDSQKFYSEKPIYLPHHYQAQDNTLPIGKMTPTRSELNLPENGFVFCAINGAYKINAGSFGIWMRLLNRVNGSVLWLLKSNHWADINLMKEAKIRGINPARLIFARPTSHEKYLAQFKQADLFLDTFPYNAGATASNALWSGLPVLTKLGLGYTARMAGSLLTSIEMPELITSTESEYEKLALELATNPSRLKAIKHKLAVNRFTTPLFDSELFTKNLESGYHKACQRYFDGQKPDVIHVS